MMISVTLYTKHMTAAVNWSDNKYETRIYILDFILFKRRYDEAAQLCLFTTSFEIYGLLLHVSIIKQIKSLV